MTNTFKEEKYMSTERIILDIPVNFTAEELGRYCKISPESPAFSAVEDAVDLVNQYAEPMAIIKWADIDSVKDDETTIEGVTFKSIVVAEKLKDKQRAFITVITAGSGLEKCEDLEDDPFLDMFNGALIRLATRYVTDYLKDNFGFEDVGMLNPGSLPDWPISENHALCGIAGDVSEIGVELNDAGYLKPWNSGSHLCFENAGGYQNCSLCKKYDCIGRHARFDRKEYIRIFGMEP